MKYENYDKCVDLVEKINGWKSKLDEIRYGDIEVCIIDNRGSRIFSIGATMGSNHEYTDYAAILVDTIEKDLEEKIKNAKRILASL